MRVTVHVDNLTVQYAGCGSHELEVELEFSSMSGPRTLAAELRMKANELDPRDEDAALECAAQAVADATSLVDAARAVVTYRGSGGIALEGAIQNLKNMLDRLHPV